MPKINTTILLQIDALRYDYIRGDDTPFMHYLESNAISGVLAPSFGFEPDAAYLAGLYPDESDGGMHYWYSPKTSKCQIVRFLPPNFDGYPEIFQKVVRKLLRLYLKKNTTHSRIKYQPGVGSIPFKLLPYFEPVEKKVPYEARYLNGRSIFSILRKYNKSFLFHSFPVHSSYSRDVYEKILSSSHPYDFIFALVGDLDGVGHKYGPNSNETKNTLKKVDKIIKDIYKVLRGIYNEIDLVIIGDHGMVEVKEILDIEKRINRLDLKLGKDYVYFLDSTLARFWFFNEKAKWLITSGLSELQQGHILTEEDKSRYHLNYSHNKFGDLIFLVTPEVLIFPNFWNNTIPEKGMHGYTPEYSGQQSAFIIHSSFSNKQAKVENPIDMRRIFPTLLKLTGLHAYSDLGISSIV